MKSYLASMCTIGMLLIMSMPWLGSWLSSRCFHIHWSWASWLAGSEQANICGLEVNMPSHVVLGLPGGCFQSFGGPYVRVHRTCIVCSDDW